MLTEETVAGMHEPRFSPGKQRLGDVMHRSIVVTTIVLLTAAFDVASSRSEPLTPLAQLPDHVPEAVIPNDEWSHEELIDILEYSADAMEVGISPDGEYLLFNDRVKGNKDLHWATRVDDRTYRYRGRVKNTVSATVDGTPSFDGEGNLYFTTLRTFGDTGKSIYKAVFRAGVAHDSRPVAGNIYVRGRNRPSGIWISLDPDVSDDGSLLFYSEGRFDPRGDFPYPFNVRGAENVNGEFVKMDDRILANVNTDSLEYAPAISANGLEIFFSRISKVDGRPKFVGIYTAKRRSRNGPFERPEKIMAITGDVEAPVLSGDENRLYYHRLDGGVFKVYRVTRRQPIAAVVTALLSAAEAADADLDAADLESQVAEVERAFAKTMADRDHAAFESFLSEEAVFLSGKIARRGKEAVAAHWKAYFSEPEPPFSWEPETVSVLDSGKLTISTGPVWSPGGKRTSTYTSIWRQEEPGVWRIIFDKGDKYCE